MTFYLVEFLLRCGDINKDSTPFRESLLKRSLRVTPKCASFS